MCLWDCCLCIHQGSGHVQDMTNLCVCAHALPLLTDGHRFQFSQV
eukprot:gene16749-11983_t